VRIADRAEVRAAVVEGMAVKATVRDRKSRATSVSTEMATSEVAATEMAAKVTAAMTPTPTMASATVASAAMTSASAAPSP
jgi:hypothetical protein